MKLWISCFVSGLNYLQNTDRDKIQSVEQHPNTSLKETPIHCRACTILHLRNCEITSKHCFTQHIIARTTINTIRSACDHAVLLYHNSVRRYEVIFCKAVSEQQWIMRKLLKRNHALCEVLLVCRLAIVTKCYVDLL